MKVRLGSIGVIAELNVEVSKGGCFSSRSIAVLVVKPVDPVGFRNKGSIPASFQQRILGLTSPSRYDALLLEYHGIEYPDLPEALEKAISVFQTVVTGHSYVPYQYSSPPPAEGWRFTFLFPLSELKLVNSTKNILRSYDNELLEL
ncbi:hypothetical protein VNO80_17385 [Phaseolus coccineus]|uniref:Uncharacterized protein n=1 Tax=Phaseolus coccineus TaxID=3886 RepID=A0AAN9MDA2_PHACN